MRGRRCCRGLDEVLAWSRGRLGLLYNRKTGGDLNQAWESALAAARRLEQEPEFSGKLKFRSDEVELTLNDRLLYPNNEETWEALKPELETFFQGLHRPGIPSITRAADPRERFRVNVIYS